MKDQKIAFFVNSLRGGGAERVLLTLANECAARGIKTDLVLGRTLGPYMANIQPELNVVDLGTNKPITGIIRLALYLRREKPDSLLSTATICNLAAVFSNILAGSPTQIIVRESSHLSSYWQNPSVHPFFMRISHKAVPFFYKRAKKVIAVSKGVAEDLINTYHIPRNKVYALYSPLITKEQASLASDEPSHKWFNDNTPIILSVGRLSFEKDFKTLIRATYEVRKTQDVRLIILGEGPLRDELYALINELDMTTYVDMPGFAQNPFAFMSRASVFALSSITDALPGCLVQAMSCGCPIVSTDCPVGPSEILNAGKYGRLIPVGEPNAMAEAISKTLTEEKMQIDNLWLKQFTTDVAIKKYFELIGIDENANTSAQ